MVKVTANQPPNVKKVFDSMEIKSNKPWDVTAVEADANSTYPYGMISKIPENKFKLREGVYTAEFLRNQKTNQSTSTILDLLKGEEIRSDVVEITLENDDTTEVNLFSVAVNSSKSRS